MRTYGTVVIWLGVAGALLCCLYGVLGVLDSRSHEQTEAVLLRAATGAVSSGCLMWFGFVVYGLGRIVEELQKLNSYHRSDLARRAAGR